MISMDKKPKIEFSKWIKWNDRNKFHLKDYPGVYMMSITDKNLEDTKVDFKDVVYIGMTNSKQGLSGRWNQFNNSINGKDYTGHSGGNTILDKLGPYNEWKLKLFVCAKALKFNVDKKSRTPEDLIKMGWISYFEYETMAQFNDKMGTEPKFNTK